MVEFTKEDCLRNIRDLKAEIESHYRQGEYKLADQKEKRLLEWRKRLENIKHTKDSMEILRLSGFTTDACPTKDSATDRNGKELKVGDIVAVKTSDPTLNLGRIVRVSGDQISIDMTGKSDIWTTPARKAVRMMKNSKDGGPGSGIKGHTTSYEKFAEESDFDVMSPEEFKKLTGLTPKEYENKYPSKKKNEDGYKMEDPKEIEAAIKRVKESGHPNPQYLAALERALEIAKQERGIKDSCSSKDGSPLEPQINQLRQKIKNLYDKAGDALNEKNKEKYNIIMSQIKIEEKSLNGLIKASMQDSCGEKVFTKGTGDGETKDISVHQYAEKLRKEAGHSISHEQMAKELKKAGWSKEEAESEVLREAVNRVYGNKDADPKVAEAEAIINLCGGVK